MPATVSRKRRQARRPDVLQKPRGVIHPRVQQVGPEHFGIVAIDCAKARSKWMLADFYGNVLLPPTIVEHNRPAFDAAVATLRQTMEQRQICDLLVAVERTGRYHHPPARAFAAGGFDVRTVHPFTTKQFRQPANPGNKTDDTDLAAITRAAINGFALVEPSLDESWRQLQLATRHRRDLVRKASLLCCQIKEHLDAALPGYAACFPTLWEHPAAMTLALRVGGSAELVAAGRIKLARLLDDANIGFQERTITRVLEWCASAGTPDVAAAHIRRIAAALEADRQQKEREIQAFEREIAGLLCATPYVLLMSIPGVNVVSAAEYAAEMGPISNYANARCITGRAGLYPSRYQSDQVDQSGPMIKCANRRLRYALMQIADCLINCNHYVAKLVAPWRARKADPRAGGNALRANQLPDGRGPKRLPAPGGTAARLRAQEADRVPSPASDAGADGAGGPAPGGGAVARRRACRRSQTFAGGVDADPGRPPPRAATAGRDPANGAGDARRGNGTISAVREQ